MASGQHCVVVELCEERHCLEIASCSTILLNAWGLVAHLESARGVSDV